MPFPDGRHIACAVSASGLEDSSIPVIDADSGVLLDTIPPTTRFAFLSWLEDCRSFVHHRYAEQHLLDSRSFCVSWAPTRSRTISCRRPGWPPDR